MIRHVVMWKLFESADGRSRAENAQIARNALLELRERIDRIRDLEVGIDVLRSERSCDLCLIASFETLDDLKYYSDHPAHLEVVEFMKKVREKAISVDFEA